MDETIARSTCDCGNFKTAENGYMICDHCDRACIIGGCTDCRSYSAAVSKRLTER
jgi:hypothetical protein